MKKLSVALVVAALAATASSVTAQGSPSGYTYDQFSMAAGQNVGQYDDAGGNVSGQWAWQPQSSTESDVAWGNPATWPPSTSEQFEHLSNGWVVLDGYQTLGGWEPQVVSKELLGDVNCQNEVNVTRADGRELYTKWRVDNAAYCLEVWGQIRPPGGTAVDGTAVDFYHKDVWFPPSGPRCSNPYYSQRICIKQYEVWKDNNPANGGTPGGPLNLVLKRDNIFALGIGPAFTIHNYYPHSGWEAYDRYYWNW